MKINTGLKRLADEHLLWLCLYESHIHRDALHYIIL